VTVIASGFSASKPVSCAQGRYGELIIAQGGGVQPKRWTGSGTATNAGIVAPTVLPSISLNTTKRYYIARADVHKPGAVYNAPPSVTFTAPASPPTGYRAATAQAYLNQSVVSELLVTDGGKHYPAPPPIVLGNSHGTGAVLTPVMDGTPPAANSITHYEIIQGPPFDDETDYPAAYRTQWSAWGSVEIPLANGSGTIARTVYVYHNACGLGPGNIASYYPVSLSLPYTVSGVAGGASGAIARVNFYGQRVVGTDCTGAVATVTVSASCFVRSVTVKAAGTGYSPTGVVTITIPASLTLDTGTGSMTTTVPSAKNLIIEGYPPGHAKNTSTPRFAVKSITITNGGSGYIVAPEIKIASDSGFGAYATCTVTNGAITAVNLESGGGGYKLAPTVTAIAGGAEAFAVARPHLRGKYQCYYRYVDNTSAANGGPIPSNLSPVREVDAGDGAQSMTWSVTAPSNTDGRSLSVELWRTTGDQALMLYRVGTGTSLVDDLTDAEVRDPDRAGYAAMPIVLPNGDLNAERFTPPPNNKAVVVRYQDRFWYGVDTGGSEPNSIYFSEVDEPESVPDINEFVLQQNARDSDAVTALVPFGASMLVMQSRHAYSLSFSKQPLRDADISHIANRGCLGQRCWDIHSGICYVLDQYGVYSITPQGEFKDLSAPINDIIRTQLDWANSAWNFVLVDPVRKVLRVFVAFKADGSAGYPTRALCYSIDTNTWWQERYPHRISAGAMVPLTGGDYRCVYGAAGGAYLLGEGHLDAGRGAIATVTITNKGAGYRTPPTVTVAGGVGAELQTVINAGGQVSGIWILHSGHGYTSGSLTISAPDDPNCAAPVQATATFTATTTASDTAMFPVYRYKTGNRAFPTDATDKRGGSGQARDVRLTYKPQPSKCDIAARLYYNNSKYARPNVANRNRGAGFAANTVDGSSRLDMAAQTTKTGYDSGVAGASFANRSLDDIQSSDRHVAVELLGARRTADPVVIYGLDVYGTAAGG
jgi:hypothetical protein